jgi:lysophospholipase L1-like esterase
MKHALAPRARLIAALLSMSHAVFGAPAPARFDPSTVRVVGRVVLHPDAVEYSWPGIYFEGRFTGSAIGLRFSDDSSHFNVEIDGRHATVVSRPGNRTVWVRGLGVGAHSIRVHRRNDSAHSSGRFLGFEPGPGERLLPAPAPLKKQMVFIGDSLTLGYGNASGKRDCSDAELAASTDSASAFPALTAKRFDADLHVNAYSGLGMVRNYGDAQPGTHYRSYAHRALTHDPLSVWTKPEHWKPGIVVVTLGGPDFAGIDASQRWTMQTLAPAFKTAYLDYLASLRDQYGSQALLLLGIPDDGSKRLLEAVQEVIAQHRLAGHARIDAFRIDMRGLDAQGCHWHASLRDHRAIAGQLIALIERWSAADAAAPGQAGDGSGRR